MRAFSRSYCSGVGFDSAKSARRSVMRRGRCGHVRMVDCLESTPGSRLASLVIRDLRGTFRLQGAFHGETTEREVVKAAGVVMQEFAFRERLRDLPHALRFESEGAFVGVE